MADFFTGSICLDDIPEAQKRKGKNGKQYINIVIAKRQKVSQYGETHTIYMSQSEEERNAKLPKHFIGGCKERNTQFSQQTAPVEAQVAEPNVIQQTAPEMPTATAATTADVDIDDLPF